MKYLAWIVLSCSLLVVGACGDDDNFCVETEYDDPAWLENVSFVGTTNLPEVQIERYVAANTLDTNRTSSGLVYSILDEGSSEKPSLSSTVVAWYKGYLTDGTIFDQSVTCRGPLNLPLEDLIPAWQEGIPKIGRGGKMVLLARPSIAYENGSPSNGSRVLVFEIELLDF